MLKLEKVTVGEGTKFHEFDISQCYTKTLTLCFGNGNERATTDLDVDFDHFNSQKIESLIPCDDFFSDLLTRDIVSQSDVDFFKSHDDALYIAFDPVPDDAQGNIKKGEGLRYYSYSSEELYFSLGNDCDACLTKLVNTIDTVEQLKILQSALKEAYIKIMEGN